MVDPRAESGFSATAGAYERGRPSYASEAVAAVVLELGLGARSTVLDLAAGTGKLTQTLMPLVGRVIAVDPSAAMLAALHDRLPSVETRVGSAEAIPAAHGAMDAVLVGQAFHWFRAVDASREIARVLAPGGGLAVLWNRARWRDAGHAWFPALDALLRPYREAAGPFPSGDDEWRGAIEASGRFAPLSSGEFEHVHRVSPDEFVALIASWSWIANVPEPEHGRLLVRVGELVRDETELRLPYRTEVFWTRLS
jgi:SAM-dependent methyltransferase